jgi:NADPH:quinone reductase-like Zn-dependent oxidoreductase
VFGLTDWTRDGTLAELIAVEARNLAPIPADVDFTVGAGLVMPGLTAWQGLFDHGRLRAGQAVLVHGAAGAVGSIATQLARQTGAFVIGTGRRGHRNIAFDFGAHEYIDLEHNTLKDVGEVDLVFDIFGGHIGKQSADLIRAGGTLVTIAGPTEARPVNGLTIDFVVEPNRSQLSEIVKRVREGKLRVNIGTISTLDDAVATLIRATVSTEKRLSAFVPKSADVEVLLPLGDRCFLEPVKKLWSVYPNMGSPCSIFFQ